MSIGVFASTPINVYLFAKLAYFQARNVYANNTRRNPRTGCLVDKWYFDLDEISVPDSERGYMVYENVNVIIRVSNAKYKI